MHIILVEDDPQLGAAIQRALAKKHLKNGHLVLYDITSSYLEASMKRASWSPLATTAMANAGTNKSSWA